MNSKPKDWWGTRESRRYRKPRPKEAPIPSCVRVPAYMLDFAYTVAMVDRVLKDWESKAREKQQ